MSEKMNNGGGLIHAWLLDGTGGGQRLDMADIEAWAPEQGVLWVHLDYTSEAARQWLQNSAGLEELVAEETRPRATAIDDGVLLAFSLPGCWALTWAASPVRKTPGHSCCLSCFLAELLPCRWCGSNTRKGLGTGADMKIYSRCSGFCYWPSGIAFAADPQALTGNLVVGSMMVCETGIVGGLLI